MDAAPRRLRCMQCSKLCKTVDMQLTCTSCFDDPRRRIQMENELEQARVKHEELEKELEQARVKQEELEKELEQARVKQAEDSAAASWSRLFLATTHDIHKLITRCSVAL